MGARAAQPAAHGDAGTQHEQTEGGCDGDLGEDIEHRVAVNVDDVVAEGPVVVSEEVNRVHALDLAEVKCWLSKDI